MNKYGQLMLRRHRQTTSEPERDSEELTYRYTRLGEGIQYSITELRDRILGPQQPGEDLHAYRIRSHQTHQQAEEIVLAQLAEETSADSRNPPSEMGSADADLALINDQLSRLARDWNETAP